MRTKLRITLATIVNEEAFLSRMFYLVWRNSSVLGMGFLQNYPQATEQEVFENVKCMGDYPMNVRRNKEYYADYVFGRMMKFGVVECGVRQYETYDVKYNLDYQSFACAFPTPQDVVKATCLDLGIPMESITLEVLPV